MGVRGLTTYIAENSNEYLKPFELCDTYLVVDGNNIASQLYKWVSKSDSAFGGDYDEYYKVVRSFFTVLKKCQVIPIVLFDGGHEKKKLKTVLSRARANIPLLSSFTKKFSKSKFFPLFLKSTFFDVMEELEIFCVQCDLEADGEIAAVARVLSCPVLSYDSDFYIHDVLYIPFSFVQREEVQVNDGDGKVRHYVKCSIYNVSDFLEKFTGFDKSLLPLVATLMGNDYIEASVFRNFFHHVMLSKDKKKSHTQRKIPGLLNWLCGESVESATKLILSHLKKENVSKALNAIRMSINDYTKACVSSSVFEIVNKIPGFKKSDFPNFTKKNVEINFPPATLELFYQCRIHWYVMDIIMLQSYYTPLQVENLLNQSPHITALKIIRAICVILRQFSTDESKPVKLYLRMKRDYTFININDQDNRLNNLAAILKKTKETRMKLLYEIIGITGDDITTISHFHDSWSPFITAFIYWVKEMNIAIRPSHIHALVLVMIANQVVQKNIGYYRSCSKFTKKKGILLDNLSETGLVISDEVEENFVKLLEKVTIYECLLVQKALIPFRQTTEKAKGKGYCSLTVHLFACFQSSLYYIMQLNALLDYPLPHLKISNFYSGTLLFNFYMSIVQSSYVEKFGCSLLKDAPNLLNLYRNIYSKLCPYSGKKEITPRRVKKKRTNKKVQSGNNESDFELNVGTLDDLNEYSDENNPYALLQNLRISEQHLLS